MTKKNVMPVVVLTVICVIVAALLGGVNYFTSKKIEEQNAQKIKDSLALVMPAGSFGSAADKLSDDAPETVKEVYTDKNGGGKVVVLVTNGGYTGKSIGITVAIGNDGKIIKAVITQNEESIVPAELKPNGSYGDHYIGASADEVVELETGATVKYTEAAIKSALYDAFVYLGFASPTSELPKTDEEIISLAKELMPGASDFKDVTPSTDGAVKRLYKEENGLGFVAYTLTFSQHGGGLETETLIAVNGEGVITNVLNLSWIVGHNPAYGGPAAPSEATVKSFYSSFIGKSVDDVGSVELITDATGSSSNARSATLEALEAIRDAASSTNYTWRILGIIVLCLAVGGFTATLIISNKRRAAK